MTSVSKQSATENTWSKEGWSQWKT